MIRSTVVQRRHFQDGGQIVVLHTAFKDWRLYTSFAIGFPGASNRPLSDRAEQARRALLAAANEIKGHSYQEAFVRSPFAALISIHSALSASSHGDAVFFLCADEATSDAVANALKID
ncbi:hypothetical protein [Stenotrophomonas sp. S39]|uniref:hypothetical protein n=1 Tax=Stenotrophomonas sp. S39 TaxID=2767451 RepID=UPI00190BE877|nr:hypothetical protein [Stenotrophomonas sp. S39]MBK0052640.1 hypothetical protein [Stenotrophomonas sp. S39]